jgi:hypothetical protein
MQKVLQTLRELDGARAAFLFDASGQILAYQSHAVYDKSLLDQVSQILVKAVDSLQIQQSEWESMVAQFSEGKLLLRNLKTHVLALIADNSINLSFANVAMRVGESKMKKIIDQGGALPSSSSLSASPAPGISDSGMSWSGTGSSGLTSSSAVPVTDEASSNFLTRCVRALAQSVGPMAKIFVKESVRKVCAGNAFSLKDSPQLLAELQKHFDDPNEYAKFKSMVTK